MRFSTYCTGEAGNSLCALGVPEHDHDEVLTNRARKHALFVVRGHYMYIRDISVVHRVHCNGTIMALTKQCMLAHSCTVQRMDTRFQARVIAYTFAVRRKRGTPDYGQLPAGILTAVVLRMCGAASEAAGHTVHISSYASEDLVLLLGVPPHALWWLAPSTEKGGNHSTITLSIICKLTSMTLYQSYIPAGP